MAVSFCLSLNSPAGAAKTQALLSAVPLPDPRVKRRRIRLRRRSEPTGIGSPAIWREAGAGWAHAANRALSEKCRKRFRRCAGNWDRLQRRPNTDSTGSLLVRPGRVRGTTNGLFSLWRQPGLGYGAIDEVALNPFALRASKRSQILARTARLNRGEFHCGAASRALRALVLSVEHGVALSSEP